MNYTNAQLRSIVYGLGYATPNVTGPIFQISNNNAVAVAAG